MSASGASTSYEGPRVYPQAVVLTTLGLVALLLSLLTLVAQLQSHNLAITTLIVGIALANLINTINPLLWPNDNFPTLFSGHVLCDIESKLQVGLSVSIPASAACICRHLASILSPSPSWNTTFNSSSAWTRHFHLAFDVVLCIFLPLYSMCVHILVQPVRYYIYGISGCQYSLLKSWLTIPLLLIWPMITSVVGTIYAILIIVRLLRHKREVSSLLRNAQTSKGRFLRVFVLAAAVAFVSGPASMYVYVRSLDGSRATWEWKHTSPKDWKTTVYTVASMGTVRFDRWVLVVGGFVIFVVFGMSSDARTMYKRWADVVGLGAKHILPLKLRTRIRGRRTMRCDSGQSPLNPTRRSHAQWFGRSEDSGVTMTEMSVEVEERKASKEIELELSLLPVGSEVK